MKNQAITYKKDFTSNDSMLVGVVSDSHNYLDPIVLRKIEHCDLILHAGDIGGADVINQLNNLSPSVISVRGNNDTPEKWSQDSHAVLEKIPEVAEINLPGGKIVLTHGHNFDPVAKRHHKLREAFSHAKTIIYGHSHKIICDQEKLPWVLNPGASGKTRTGGGASCLLIQTNKNQWGVSEFRNSNVT